VRVSCSFQHEQAKGRAISLDYLLAPGVDVMAIVVRGKEELGIWSDMHSGFSIHSNFPAVSSKTRFWRPEMPSVTIRATDHYVPAGTWRWGGLTTNDGRGLFVSSNGDDTIASGEAVDVDMGCVMDAAVARAVPAHGELEGLFFVLPGVAADGDARAIWQAFHQLP